MIGVPGQPTREVVGELGLPQEEAICSAVIVETSLMSASLFFLHAPHYP